MNDVVVVDCIYDDTKENCSAEVVDAVLELLLYQDLGDLKVRRDVVSNLNLHKFIFEPLHPIPLQQEKQAQKAAGLEEQRTPEPPAYEEEEEEEQEEEAKEQKEEQQEICIHADERSSTSKLVQQAKLLPLFVYASRWDRIPSKYCLDFIENLVAKLVKGDFLSLRTPLLNLLLQQRKDEVMQNQQGEVSLWNFDDEADAQNFKAPHYIIAGNCSWYAKNFSTVKWAQISRHGLHPLHVAILLNHTTWIGYFLDFVILPKIEIQGLLFDPLEFAILFGKNLSPWTKLNPTPMPCNDLIALARLSGNEPNLGELIHWSSKSTAHSFW